VERIEKLGRSRSGVDWRRIVESSLAMDAHTIGQHRNAIGGTTFLEQ
jgi:hypothetical protein